MADPQQIKDPAITMGLVGRLENSVLTIDDLNAVDELMKRYGSTLGFLPRAALVLKTIFKRKACWEPGLRTLDSSATSCTQQIATDSVLRNSAYRRPTGAGASRGSF